MVFNTGASTNSLYSKVEYEGKTTSRLRVRNLFSNSNIRKKGSTLLTKQNKTIDKRLLHNVSVSTGASIDSIKPNGISPDRIKVDAIKSAPAPTTQSGLRSFRGMAMCCSKFIANFSNISRPLRELTPKNTTFQWTKTHEHITTTII